MNKWHRWITENQDCRLDVVIYVRTSPKFCYDRLNLRGRVEEKDTVSLQFLEEIHERHEDWLIALNNTRYYVPSLVIVVDGDKQLNDMCNDLEIKMAFVKI